MAIDIPLLIGVDEFKFYTATSESFTAEIITPAIIQSTDLAAQNVLGTALMVKLKSDYNGGTLAAKYQELYDSDKASVLKMVIWQTFVMALPRLLYKIGAATISVGDTDEVSSIDDTQLASMQRTAESSMVFYENQVKQYLTTNYSSFAELVDSTPNYIPADTKAVYTSQGTTYSVNKVYEI